MVCFEINRLGGGDSDLDAKPTKFTYREVKMAVVKLCSIPECGKVARTRGWCNAHHHRYLRYGDPLKGRTSLGAPLVWLKQNLDYAGDDCLIWPFGHNGGYGSIHIGRRKTLVSRIVCEHHNGPPPTPKHDAAHSCGKGNEGCITPKHLSWKTRKENMEDCKIHGTVNLGQRNGAVKLSEEQVLEIKKTHGVAQTKIAKYYGISQSSVSLIKTGKNWKWLT